MTTEYLDLELEIGGGDSYEYELVIRSPVGTERGILQFGLEQTELENLLLAFQNALLRSGHSYRKTLTSEEKTIQTFGCRLFETLFHGNFRPMYYESKHVAEAQEKGLRIKLHIVAAELAAIPWEYLYDEHEREFICLSHKTPIVRYLEAPLRHQSIAVSTPLQILGMVASPSDLPQLDIEREKDQLEKSIAGLRDAGQVKLTWLQGGTSLELANAMGPEGNSWHIFHFIGHGGYDTNADEGTLALCNSSGQQELLSATKLGRVLCDHRTLRLAVLNMCSGAHASQDDIFSGAATTLVRRGIPAVVGMQYQITDEAAIEFAKHFYGGVARGLPLDTAVAEARKIISLAPGNSLEWGVPVLFLQTSNGELFSTSRPTSDTTNSSPAKLKVNASDYAVKTSAYDSNIEVLSSGQRGELIAAIIEAYPSWSTFSKILSREFGENVDSVVNQGNISEKTFDLIFWAEQTGGLERLVKTVFQYRPENTRLHLIASSILDASSINALTTESQHALQPIEFEWITVPNGGFEMGITPTSNTRVFTQETPRHTIVLPEYQISRFQVTNLQYRQFIEETNHNSMAGKKKQSILEEELQKPVVFVSWYDAKAFCEWASVLLPSEPQWEKAARGVDGRRFPWGDSTPTAKHCNFAEHESGTTVVGSYSPAGDSPYSVADMAGNVWEWTNSLYKGYPYDSLDGRENETSQDRRVLRGGSWRNEADEVRSSNRYSARPTLSTGYVGFRVVRIRT